MLPSAVGLPALDDEVGGADRQDKVQIPRQCLNSSITIRKRKVFVSREIVMQELISNGSRCAALTGLREHPRRLARVNRRTQITNFLLCWCWDLEPARSPFAYRVVLQTDVQLRTKQGVRDRRAHGRRQLQDVLRGAGPQLPPRARCDMNQPC